MLSLIFAHEASCSRLFCSFKRMNHGGNMCNFTVLALADIPVAWQQPPARQWLAEVASRLGIESSAVFETVVLEVPQTALGNEYLQWHQTRTRDDFEAVPVMLDSLRDFVSNHGAQGLREFEKSMLYLGCPCHFARVSGKRA